IIVRHQSDHCTVFRSCRVNPYTDSVNRAVKYLQAEAAMLWLQNFHVLIPEGQKAEYLAGPALSEIMAVLDAALARASRDRPAAATILAHLGWAHWMNQKIAFKEFGDAAEQDLRKALSLDPSNVYGNAMLGNWLLQTHGALD